MKFTTKTNVLTLIICLLVLASMCITLFACSSSVVQPADDGVKNEALQDLQILKSELKLTQEQTMSQIKAEYLLENNGYNDDDEIVVMVALQEESLLDAFNDRYYREYNTVAEFAESQVGVDMLSKIKSEQASFINSLKRAGYTLELVNSYNTIINAVAIEIPYGSMKSIEGLGGVSSVIMSETYNRPQDTKEEGYSAVENIVDIYETGIYKSDCVDFKGRGTSVAILDSGFDLAHSVFSVDNIDYIPEDQLMITAQDIKDILSSTMASSLTAGLDFSDVYYSTKIPFSYDYADKDPDVNPYDSEHGTHVAGIIAGKDDVITGIAIETQLVLLKVFPDLDDGGKTEDITAALEDAVLLGVDAINMSLGSSCGFAREEDGNAINDIYDKIKKAGISLITAASNSYSSGYGGDQGNTNMVTNPDSSTVGSPSTYEAALSVASISGTKSKYLVANGSDVVFFNESNAVTGDPNDFFQELFEDLNVTDQKITLNYVTVPGVGKAINYNGIDVKGKIALVRRGDNTFEEKAMNAKSAGAIACIIYNNIDGDILMSMGKTDHIPTISISKDYGSKLAEKAEGTIVIDISNQAGPFMSDFSSWGPLPSLELKPEITAHGGNIKSSVPGGGYDELSGTSMATPNLCGIVVLIRQYLKEKYPDITAPELSKLTNQMLMSTATIILNEEGNPYSPRKQGAGLASISNVVNTRAYLSVDGIDRPKLDLLDDPERTGVYTMKFNVHNMDSLSSVVYNIDLIGMTESVSAYEITHVAEKATILSNNFTISVENGELNGNMLTVKAGETAKITLVYTLTEDDMNMMDELFPYGMYVEGFVKLIDMSEDNAVDLNIPFLAFYGDWTQAPMFDKTYYEVESEAHDQSIDDEDKIKADYYATTPYGSYFYNYIIPLGTYLYDVDTSKYDEIPATEEHIAISNVLGTIDGISAVYAGLLRNAKTMTYSIVDTVTGDVVYEEVFYNARKAYSYGGTPIPNYEYLKLKSTDLGLINNRTYTFSMVGRLDYGDGGEANNVRSEFTFDFFFDDEAPVIKSANYEKVYDKTLKKNRYYINLVVYDNHYVQSITPIIFTSSSSYTFLTENPIPVYSEKGANNKVRFEITDYLSDLYADAIITSGLAFSIDDYALNSNIYICQLPGTRGDFKFTSDGTMDGADLIILSVEEGELVDLTKYLATSDTTVDEEKDYLKYLVWTSSNEKVIEVNEGILKANKAGRATVTVQEQMELKQAILIINVKSKSEEELAEASDSVIGTIEESKIKEIRFSYFDTLFAYSRAAQTSEIGQTGDRKFISAMNGISFYPGEKIQLFYDIEPWYVADSYNVTFESTNPLVASVNEDGEVTGLKEGTTSIVLRVDGSSLIARVKITVKNEFIIENRSLIAYKGLGGEVVIPDDEGILYIGAYAFCLYTTDNTIELTEDDYDANKIPATNTSVTSVVIPDGVEDIQKYAFYNCSGLRSVVIPDTVKYIRECAFYNDVKLEEINIKNVQTIGREAFKGCEKLDNVDLSKVYAIGSKAFDGCSSLSKADLSSLRNTGDTTFRHCTSLKELILNEHTKLAQAMFVDIGIEEVTIYNKGTYIPAFLFANCLNLKKVTLKYDLEGIQNGAFSGCEALTEFVIEGELKSIGEQVFYNDTALESFTLPDCEVGIDVYAFYKCESLQELVFGANTYLTSTNGAMFQDTKLSTFSVSSDNKWYSGSDNGLLLSKDGKSIVLASIGCDFGDLVIDESIERIEDGAFSGATINSLTITNPSTVIGNYAFANCLTLTKITFPTRKGVELGMHVFNGAEALVEVENSDKVLIMGDYAFANTSLKQITLGSNGSFGEGAFFQSLLESVTIGEKSSFGMGAFQKCLSLITVNMPEGGGVKFGQSCFANDANLKNIDLTKISTVIASEAFYGCSSLYEANIPHVTRIGSYAFADCSSLTYVTLENVQVIGEGAFGLYEQYSQAPRIEQINLPDTLTSLGDGVFIGCSALQSVIVPDSVVNFGDFMFTYCESLTYAKLGSGIKNLGQYTFYGCSLLSEVEFSGKEIGELAFSQTSSLSYFDLSNIKKVGWGAFESSGLSGDIIANKLVYVDDYAFQNANIKSFSATSLANIGTSAFQNNAELQSFTFSEAFESIGTESFLGCKALKSFYTPDGNQTGTINDFAYLNDGVLYTKMESGYMQLTSVPAGREAQTLIVDEGTYRIDRYAGNENEFIKVITLPDSLKLIGNYAFYGYSKLNTVEFKSVTAPALEDYYNSSASLEESDPGYELLHNSFDLFGFELYYYTFIDLVGKKEPISMVLPANADITGYDSLVYEAYFGTVDNAMRSNYVAMEKNMINFISYAKKVQDLKVISLTSETLINNAVACYKALTQNPESYGIDLELWNGYVESVTNAKASLTKLKIEDAGQKVVAVQERIDSLPTEFRVEDLELLRSVAEDINALLPKDKALLDTSRYDLLIASYDSYRESVVQEVRPIINSFDNIVLAIAVISSLLAIGFVFALKAI